METNDDIIYDQYEWIYYFFEGFDVTSFNNDINQTNGNNNLNNFPIELQLKLKFKNNILIENLDNNKISLKKNGGSNLTNNKDIKKINSLSNSNRIPKNNGEILFDKNNIENQFMLKGSVKNRNLKKNDIISSYDKNDNNIVTKNNNPFIEGENNNVLIKKESEIKKKDIIKKDNNLENNYYLMDNENNNLNDNEINKNNLDKNDNKNKITINNNLDDNKNLEIADDFVESLFKDNNNKFRNCR